MLHVSYEFMNHLPTYIHTPCHDIICVQGTGIVHSCNTRSAHTANIQCLDCTHVSYTLQTCTVHIAQPHCTHVLHTLYPCTAHIHVSCNPWFVSTKCPETRDYRTLYSLQCLVICGFWTLCAHKPWITGHLDVCSTGMQCVQFMSTVGVCNVYNTCGDQGCAVVYVCTMCTLYGCSVWNVCVCESVG